VPKLLVSVRDAQEARLALAAGVDLIDVKEPLRGSLGAADAHVIDEVIGLVAGRTPVSAAFGELADFSGAAFRGIAGLSFFKIGLAGCARRQTWARDLAAAIGCAPTGALPVAVAYADWQTAHAPLPDEVLACAAELGCRALLVDTFSKHDGALTNHWPIAQIARFARAARDARLLLVLAGSLDADSIRQVLPLQPDYIAVRGAACRGGRSASLDAARLRHLIDLVKGQTAAPTAAAECGRKFA